jgi:hypothetical protein
MQSVEHFSGSETPMGDSRVSLNDFLIIEGVSDNAHKDNVLL